MSTGDFVRHRDASLRAEDRIAAIADVIGESNLTLLDANKMARRLMGDTIYANVLLLGAAWQQGLVPVSHEAIMRAIELNGVQIEKNKQAFTWGRVATDHPEHVEDLAVTQELKVPETLDRIVERRAAFLADYQDDKLSRRYAAFVDKARDAELDAGGDGRFAEAVAKSYFKLLSYKDEYEVARLHTQTGFLESVKRDFGNGARVRFHLAPPILSSQTDARGRPRKREFGAWMIPVFRLLAALRSLRGSRLDFFGMTAERRMERALIVEFENRVEQLLGALNAANLGLATEIVGLYMDIRGYGPVKEQAVEDVRTRVANKINTFATMEQRAA
jgi:indolepyruvate ferredoxin oxidoreductase